MIKLLACLLLLVWLIDGGSSAFAQAASSDANPLRPADTSSPRATLRSFLSDADFILRAAMSGVIPDQRAVQAFQRAVETLDFSNTPNGELVAVQSRRVVLLKEVLDRIALPDDAAIPGRAEVAEGGITRWAVPNTRIQIVRMESGVRDGEFLFSAATVEALDRLYGLVRDLPYQPGATEGAYDFFVRTDAARAAEEGQMIGRRLKPIDTSTPRTVVQELLESVNSAYALVMEAEARWRAAPRALTEADAERLDKEASQLLKRAATALDLSGVPEAQRQDVAIETVLKLKEILDRMPLHPIGIIPDALGVARLRAPLGATAAVRWRVPNSELDIVAMPEGDRQGEFLFSSRTVERVDDLYWKVADLPYRTEVPGLEVGYVSPGLSPGFYEYYVSRPGGLVPYASVMGRWLADLPPWLLSDWGGLTMWQWLGLTICVLFVAILGYFVFRFVWRLSHRLPKPFDEWAQIVAPIAVSVLVTAAVRFMDNSLNITGDLLAAVTAAGGYTALLMRALAVFLLFRAVAETITVRRLIRAPTLDVSLLRMSGRVLGFLVAVYVLVAGARNLGADVVPLIAGLGVGGLAVALAAQKTLANFIGTLILFVERPISEGDFFRAGDLLGSVERVGFHSTRIRTPERSVITVPNAQLSEMRIDNISKRDRRLLKTVLSLRDDTTMEQMRGILNAIGQLLSDHPKVLQDSARVRFVGFGAYSEDVELFAYLDCVDQKEFLAIQEELLMRIEEIITAAGSGFAVPSQITHVTGALIPEAQRTTSKPE